MQHILFKQYYSELIWFKIKLQIYTVSIVSIYNFKAVLVILPTFYNILNHFNPKQYRKKYLYCVFQWQKTRNSTFLHLGAESQTIVFFIKYTFFSTSLIMYFE